MNKKRIIGTVSCLAALLVGEANAACNYTGSCVQSDSGAYTASPTLGIPNSATGSIGFANSGSAGVTSLTPGAPSGSVTLTLPSVTGTILGSNSTINLSTQPLSGSLPVANLNGGSGASGSTFWRGDGTWSSPGGINSGVANSVPYYASTGTILSPLGTAANTALIANGAGVPSFSSVNNATLSTMAPNTYKGNCTTSTGVPQDCSLTQGSALNFYANPSTGNDSNDCRSATVSGSSGPCLTVQHTVNVALGYDAGGQYLNINLAAGTYTTGLITAGAVRGSANGNLTSGIKIIGAGSSTTIMDDNTGVCGTIVPSNGAVNMVITGVKIQKTSGCGGSGSGIFAQGGAYVAIGPDINFGVSGSQHIHVEGGAQVEIVGNYTISGGGFAHYGVSTGGRILNDGYTVTCTGSPAFSDFVYGQQNGVVIILTGSTFSGCGSVTGNRYAMYTNSVLDVNGQTSSTYIPGNANGLLFSGARYDPPIAPTVSSCTNGSINSTSTDNGIYLNWTGNGTTCTVNFAQQHTNAPACVASLSNGATPSVATTTSTMIIQASFVNTESAAIVCVSNP